MGKTYRVPINDAANRFVRQSQGINRLIADLQAEADAERADPGRAKRRYDELKAACRGLLHDPEFTKSIADV